MPHIPIHPPVLVPTAQLVNDAGDTVIVNAEQRPAWEARGYREPSAQGATAPEIPAATEAPVPEPEAAAKPKKSKK